MLRVAAFAALFLAGTAVGAHAITLEKRLTRRGTGTC
jgi:hypothetical protein